MTLANQIGLDTLLTCTKSIVLHQYISQAIPSLDMRETHTRSDLKMAQESDLEAGVHPISPPPVHEMSGKGHVAQRDLAKSEPALEISTYSTSISSAREQNPLLKEPRRRRGNKQKSPPQIESLRQADKFYEALRAELEDATRHHCLFICWENNAYDQRAVPLLIEDKEGEVTVYRDMKGTLYKVQPWWSRYNPFYQVQYVEEVEVRVIILG